MQPLNYSERKSYLIKFLAANLLTLCVFGFSIYSYVFVDKRVSDNQTSHKSEIAQLNAFMTEASKICQAYSIADADADRSMHTVSLNELINERKSNFETHLTVFNQAAASYRNLIKHAEVGVDAKSSSAEDCDTKLEALEKEIADLKQDSKSSGSNLKMAKSAIQRIASDLSSFGAEVSDWDLCPGTSGGKKDMKQKIKSSTSAFKNQLIEQVNNI